MTGTVLVNKKLLTVTVPVNKKLLTGTVPVDNFNNQNIWVGHNGGFMLYELSGNFSGDLYLAFWTTALYRVKR